MANSVKICVQLKLKVLTILTAVKTQSVKYAVFVLSCSGTKDLVNCVSLCAGVIQLFSLKSQKAVGVHVLSILFETLKH